jgi:hypothetical protein
MVSDSHFCCAYVTLPGALLAAWPDRPHVTRSMPCQQVYQGGETTDGRRIYVGNINYDCREDEIRNRFNEVCVAHAQISCARGTSWI